MASRDPHPAWLTRLRYYRMEIASSDGLSSGSSTVPHLREEVTRLEHEISVTPASTKEGLLAQTTLLTELAWNEKVARLIRSILSGVQRLVP